MSVDGTLLFFLTPRERNHEKNKRRSDTTSNHRQRTTTTTTKAASHAHNSDPCYSTSIKKKQHKKTRPFTKQNENIELVPFFLKKAIIETIARMTDKDEDASAWRKDVERQSSTTDTREDTDNNDDSSNELLTPQEILDNRQKSIALEARITSSGGQRRERYCGQSHGGDGGDGGDGGGGGTFRDDDRKSRTTKTRQQQPQQQRPYRNKKLDDSNKSISIDDVMDDEKEKGVKSSFKGNIVNFWQNEFQRLSYKNNGNNHSSSSINNSHGGLRGPGTAETSSNSMLSSGTTIEKFDMSLEPLPEDEQQNNDYYGATTTNAADTMNVDKQKTWNQKVDPSFNVEEKSISSIHSKVDDSSTTGTGGINAGSATARNNDATPGAYFQPGPGLNRADSNDSVLQEYNASLATSRESENQQESGDIHQADIELASSMKTANNNDLFESDSTSNHTTTSTTLKARAVDNAEVILDAENVEKDNFQRKCKILAVICGTVCIIAVCLAVTLTSRNKDNDEYYRCHHSEICCIDNFIAPYDIPLMCQCMNATKGVYDDLDEIGKNLYETLRNDTAYYGYVDQEIIDNLDREGCAAHNQILLTLAHYEAWGVPPDFFKDKPVGVLEKITVLLYFYVALDGVNWRQQGGWYREEGFCDWLGVDCIFIDTVVGLSLPAVGLHGSMPTHIGWMTTLRSLDLSFNEDLSGPIPSEISNLSVLRNLALSHVPIGGQIPTFLATLPKLSNLNMINASLTGTLPADIFSPSANMRIVSLASNHLIGTIPTEIGLSSKLEILRLQRNSLSGMLPTEMEELTNLELLDISQNQLNTTIPAFLGTMKRLEMINLCNSGLTGTIPESFCISATTEFPDDDDDDVTNINDDNPSSLITSSPTSSPSPSSSSSSLQPPLSQPPPPPPPPPPPRPPRRRFQLIINCTSNIEFCSCCSEADGSPVRIACGETLPEQAISFR